MNVHPDPVPLEPALNLSCERTECVLPKELSLEYEILSCLKYAETAAVYLARQSATGKTVLLKTASDPLLAEALRNEKELLEFIHQQDSRIAAAFPVPLCLIKLQDTHYYIRTYIEGKTLEELCESKLRKPGLPCHQALDYIIHLTELLGFLHHLNPPIIHRDIKPQNVVVDSSGICHFIDLGISRFFQGTRKSDTLIMGTRLTAPPEQFGYQQTDFRSDLYSLGILLLYCLTGEYEVSDNILSELEPALRQIIRKATMFDPNQRYQTTGELLPDLIQARFPSPLQPPLKAPSRKKPSGWIAAFFLLILNLCLVGVFFLHGQKQAPSQEPQLQRGAEAESQAPASGFYQFREPLIEEAVCQFLGISPGSVTENDLTRVTELHIMGAQIFSDDSEIWFKGKYPWFYDHTTRESGLYLQTGSIRSLEDITHMPNLAVLSLYGQQISDISLLKGTRIQKLGLGYNPLTDLTPLENNDSITYLNLATLDIATTDILSTLPNLTWLNISGTRIFSLRGLENCSLKELNLFDQTLTDYQELKNLTFLTSLTLSDLNNRILDGIADLPRLRELDLVWANLEDFTELSSLKQLNTLKIYDSQCQSYDGLDQFPNLRCIVCTRQQYQEISGQYPENNFVFQYE